MLPPVAGVGGGGLPGLSIVVTAQVDPDNVIAESDETNNSFSQTFQTSDEAVLPDRKPPVLDVPAGTHRRGVPLA